jgi:hypothetical protein
MHACALPGGCSAMPEACRRVRWGLAFFSSFTLHSPAQSHRCHSQTPIAYLQPPSRFLGELGTQACVRSVPVPITLLSLTSDFLDAVRTTTQRPGASELTQVIQGGGSYACVSAARSMTSFWGAEVMLLFRSHS